MSENEQDGLMETINVDGDGDGDGDGDQDDDALQDLIQEAENLMTDFDNEADQIFSIDSDDEEEAVAVDDPLSTASNVAPAAVEDHPLSMQNLSTAATAMTPGPSSAGVGSGAGAGAGAGISIGASPLHNNATTATATATSSNGMSSFFSSTGNSVASVAQMNHLQHHPNVTAGVDQFKYQTSRFASGIASMAQRAANQVAAATAPVQVANGPPTMATISMAGSSQSAYAPTYPGQQQTTISNTNGSQGIMTSPSSLPSTMSRTPPGTRVAANHGIQPVKMELDKEQKEQLIKDHVGTLLTGERVIMFLTNLLHVSDTTGLSYLASQQQQQQIHHASTDPSSSSSSSSSSPYMWCCAMTYYRLILFSTASPEQMQLPAPSDWNPSCWPSLPAAIKVIEVPLASMARVEKTVYQAAGSSFMGIVLTAKDCGRIIRFTTPSYADTGRAFDSLNTYAFPGRRNLGYLFAFESKRQEVMASVQVDATTGQQNITLPPTPKRFDPMIEYPRLLNNTSITNAPWMMWASINSTYQLSPSYSAVLVGPATLDETKQESQHVIQQCAAFRSERRLPSMAWCGTGGSSIWRASQPKVGLQGNRSPADELFLRHIAESARGANAMADPAPIYPRAILQQLTGDYNKDWVPESGCSLKILDLRPRASAMANRTGGYGYENTSYYNNTTIQFCNIGNIHAVRDSYQKLCGVCNSENTADVNFLSLVEDTKWLSHIRIILAASWETAYWVHVWRMPVLLHCSHGWDRTSQVSALAQVLLDPYYRTCKGFSVLVEKDFMSFGHPFHLRCAHGEGRSQNSSAPQSSSSSSNDEGQISPIFLQFVDCVYQIVQLFPEYFEFNSRYLLELSFHIYSCRFGTMLCDTEREREVLANIRLRTYSLWDYLDSQNDLKNEDYQKVSSSSSHTGEGVLLMPLSTLLRNVKLWSERHCCFSRKPTFRTLNHLQAPQTNLKL